MELNRMVERLEMEARLPEGKDERFNGYGVMGLPFRSEHVLALRHFPASSVGPGYTSVWHRHPDGVWNFYANVAPQYSCTRFFGSAVARAIVTPIQINWSGPEQFNVKAEADSLDWEVKLSSTRLTSVFNTFINLIPSSSWRNEKLMKSISQLASALLGVGKINLSGTSPNGQHFIACPSKIWFVTESKAILNGEDFGPVGALAEQAHLEDFWIPQKGIFSLGQAYFDRFNPFRHHMVTHIQTIRDPDFKNEEL